MSDRKELLNKLELVTLVINHSSFVSEFKNFHFNKETLTATDGTITLMTSSPLPEEIFSVKADPFLNLLRNIKADEIKLKIKDDSLSVRTKKIEGKFTISTPRDFQIEIPAPTEISNCPDLLAGIHLCSFGACKEKTSGAISGVRIEPTTIYSTDRFRVHRFKLEKNTYIPTITLPIKLTEILHKVKDEVKSYQFFEDKFYIVLKDNTTIESSILTDEYPELEQYFETLDISKFVELKFTENLQTVLDKHLKSFLGNVDFYDKEIKFVVDGNTCILYSESKSGGNLLEEIELEDSIENCEFIVNPMLLSEVLQYGNGKFFYNSEDALILLDANKLQILIQTKV